MTNEGVGKSPAEIILAGLLDKPSRIEKFDIRDSQFKDRELREAFSFLDAQWEEGRPEKINVEMIRAAGHDGAAERLADLRGYGPTSDEEFRIYFRRFQEGPVKKSLIRKLDHLARSKVDVEDFDFEELRSEWAELDRLEQEAQETRGPRFIRRLACDVKTRRVTWLWPNVMPMGMVTIIQGDPDIGKTFVAVDVVARVTRGHGFPFYRGKDQGEPVKGAVVYITSEGVKDKILVPRLVAAGADLSKVEIIEGLYDKRRSFEILDINKHLPELSADLKNNPDIKVVVIDPIASHLNPKININGTLEMRTAMDCLNRFAEEVGCALPVVSHLNKDVRKPSMYRSAGSGQIMAAVKASWAVVKKPNDENGDRRYLGPIKLTSRPKGRSLAFEIKGVDVPLDDGTVDEIGHLVWAPEPVDFDLEAAISPGAFALKSKVGAAITFLRSKLADGPRRARGLYSDADAQGITSKQLWQGKDKEGIEDGREEFGGPSIWYYPGQKEKGGIK